MRVLHISSGNLYGGVETLLVTLARNRQLCPDMEPHFALSFEGRLSKELRNEGVPVYHLGEVRASRPWTVWKARERLRTILKSGDFQSVICHMPWPLAMFGPAISECGKLAFWLHNPVDGSHWIERWARRSEPTLAICNSRFTALSLPAIFPATPQVITYYPVDLDRRIIKEDSYTKIRHEMEMRDNDVAIVQVSRMEAWKGHRLHLQALSLLKDIPNWTCWIVGGAQRPAEQTYLLELKREAIALRINERVRFVGQRSDVPDILSAADLFCQPNEGPEPFGIVFIEALLAGLPVVSTAIGGALEIVDHSCGRLVPPKNPEALADTLRRLVLSKSLRTELGRHGPERAAHLCDPLTQLASLRDALKSAA